MGIFEGVITKGIGGFYYVNTEEGLFECRARGIFRKRGFAPLVGDCVVIETSDSSHGVINEVRERKNSLIRPAVANVTRMAVVVAVSSPVPNPYILDKLIASAEFAKLKIAVCFNKSDLGGSEDLVEAYKNAGFEVVVTSAAENIGIDELKNFLANEITVFAGNSGVGKSSLINRLMERDMFETGTVSEKLERGRHTTRHSELAPLPFGGYIIDTPGFSSFDVNTIPLEGLSDMFREFGNVEGGCRFPDCSHRTEPDCCIINAVRDGKIAVSRHESYVQLYNEIKTAKENIY
ncbi:MAG: ribosome small subunit-dependent GTPase A [Ruminococcaceae bacterium]|nr:ribosome small subunit-dependent GTPase A [Oscillospiraceae bacterium]